MAEQRVKYYDGETFEDQLTAYQADATVAEANGWRAVKKERWPDRLKVTWEYPVAAGDEWAPPTSVGAGHVPATATATAVNIPAIGVIAGGAMVAIGAFLPWATVNAGIASASVSGMDGSDGWIALVIGVLTAVVGLASLSGGNSGGAVLGLLFGLAGGGLGVLKYFSVKDAASGDALASALVQVGIGVYLMIAGGVIAALASLGNGGPAAARR